MSKLRDTLAPFDPGLSKKEWEGVAIAAAAVALWFFQRQAKWHRWTGGWAIRSVFIDALIPFALHAYFVLEGTKKRYAGGVLAALTLSAIVVRFAALGPSAWAVIAVGVALSVPLFFYTDVRDLGVRLGEVKLWAPFVVVGYLVTLVGIVAMAGSESFLKSYPYVPLRPNAMGMFVFRELLELVDMFTWEFFFRGFLLFALASRIGVLAAILVQATLFACAHVNKPELEIYASIAGGLLLGQLCFRVKSMMPAFVVHQAVFLSAEIAGAWVKLRQ